jgi:peptidoglycan/xylan/chitin deacetylase (PgdA/CDA1 family)
MAAPSSLLLAPACATASDVPVEPRMRLAAPPPDRLVVALTLDACQGTFDEQIATALVESGIPATIFATGLWLRRNPAGLAFLLTHCDLFGIENHGEDRRDQKPAKPRRQLPPHRSACHGRSRLCLTAWTEKGRGEPVRR